MKTTTTQKYTFEVTKGRARVEAPVAVAMSANHEVEANSDCSTDEPVPVTLPDSESVPFGLESVEDFKLQKQQNESQSPSIMLLHEFKSTSKKHKTED